MKNLEQLLPSWQSRRKLTLDLLRELPEEHLAYSVGANMGTLGKQFRHIGDVQLCYTEAIKSGKISFDHYRRDYSLENSKQKLLDFLQETDQDFLRLVEENSGVEIDWFGEKWTLEQHLQALIEHEILHHGQLVVYLRTLNLKFPKSWELWGL